jgi:uncharacterized protein (TIGR03067 family)
MYPALLFGLAVTVAAPAAKEKKTEPPSIVGSWTVEKVEFGGMALPVGAAGFGELSLTFAADGAFISRKGGQEKPETGRYAHDAKKSPAEIDITETRGGAKDMTVRGIYKIDGETLTICMSPMGERPTKFESPAGGQTIMMTFKRMKKD